MISFDKLFDIDPKLRYFPEYNCQGNFEGIEAITYRGADLKGMPTRIFAHIGFPKNAREPLPAVVLVHGGGGHPDDMWIKKWNEHGYAAIAMSTDGFFPSKPIPALYEEVGAAEMVHGLIDPFYEEGHTCLPSTTHISDSGKPVDEQWMFHAIASIIIAHNILRADERVDNDKIGICGISWGGIMTAIAIGYDPRFAFAIPIYGSGYLGCGLSGLDKIFNVPGTQKWYAERRFHLVSVPVMWLCWNDDCCFSVNSNSMSYEETKPNNKSTCLSMKNDMGHSHPCAYEPKESYWFADTVVNGGYVPEVRAEYKEGKVLYSCDGELCSARLFYITEKMTYSYRQKHGIHATFMDQEWKICELDTAKNEAELPEGALGKYVEFTLKNGIVLTTPYNEFKK